MNKNMAIALGSSTVMVKLTDDGDVMLEAINIREDEINETIY